jgi:hypothetical protein
MSYWFSLDPVPALVRPVSPVFECGDLEILARVIEVLS